MMRLSLIVAFAGLLSCGCGRMGDLVAEPAAADGVGVVGDGGQEEKPVAPVDQSGNENVKSRLIRALIQTVDEIKGESSEVKDSLKRSLRDADRELSTVLGGKSKQLILQANKKPRVPILGQSPTPSVKTSTIGGTQPQKTETEKPKESGKPKTPERPSAAKPPEPAVTVPQDAPAHKGGAKSPTVQALMKAIDEAEGESRKVKDELKRLLREADERLSASLVGNSERLIIMADKAPSRPVVHESRPGGVKVREFRWTKPDNSAPK